MSRRGFSLVEILIALVIVGVVAGLAFPVIASQTEKSRGQEAVQHLDAVKDALLKYYSLNGTYAGATFVTIGYDPNLIDAGQNNFFSYTLSNLTAVTYKITAQREPAASNAGNTIILDQTGTVTKNGAYV